MELELGVDVECVFMYQTFFSSLGLRFSFTNFESSILACLNIALTQLHLNGWGFIRAFEVLSNFLSRHVSTRPFFSYFYPKGTSKGGWVSLHGRLGRKLLNGVDMSYKHFKDQFFKVKSTGTELTFFLNDRGEKRYPPYWNKGPSFFRPTW